MSKKINFFDYDIPEKYIKNATEIAIDTESMGLQIDRDRLCCVQMLINDKDLVIVHFPFAIYDRSPNLCSLLGNKDIHKIFHFARFDIAIVYKYLGVLMENISCTRTISKVARTYSDKHSLKELCKELLKKDLNKGEQCSDWGRAKLTDSQLQYAASDVLYLFDLLEELKKMCQRENRYEIAKTACNIIPSVVFIEVSKFNPVSLIDH